MWKRGFCFCTELPSYLCMDGGRRVKGGLGVEKERGGGENLIQSIPHEYVKAHAISSRISRTKKNSLPEYISCQAIIPNYIWMCVGVSICVGPGWCDDLLKRNKTIYPTNSAVERNVTIETERQYRTSTSFVCKYRYTKDKFFQRMSIFYYIYRERDVSDTLYPWWTNYVLDVDFGARNFLKINLWLSSWILSNVCVFPESCLIRSISIVMVKRTYYRGNTIIRTNWVTSFTIPKAKLSYTPKFSFFKVTFKILLIIPWM